MLSVLVPCALMTVSRLLRYADECIVFLVIPLVVLWLGNRIQRLGETKRFWRIPQCFFLLFAVIWGTLRINRIVTIPYMDDGFGFGDILFGLYWYTLAALFFLGMVIRFLQKHLKPFFNPEKYSDT